MEMLHSTQTTPQNVHSVHCVPSHKISCTLHLVFTLIHNTSFHILHLCMYLRTQLTEYRQFYRKRSPWIIYCHRCLYTQPR
jgi:hypothetical protein